MSSKKDEKIANCIKERGNWGKIEKNNRFDHEGFDVEKTKEVLIDASPKMQALIDKIKQLDEKDMKKHGKLFKHFIYSDVKSAYGAKLIASGLKSAGFNHAYSLKKTARGMSFALDIQKKDSNNFATLTSVLFFEKPIGVNFRRELLKKFNERPNNIYGEEIRIIILDSGFREGVDLFDVKYVHLFETIATNNDEKQAIGRATRFCGQKGLVFDSKAGWPLHVYKYETLIPAKIQKYLRKYIDFQDDSTETFFDLFMHYSNIDPKKLRFANELQNVVINGAVDKEYTKNIHEFKVPISDDDAPDTSAKSGGSLKQKYNWPTVKVENLCGPPPEKRKADDDSNIKPDEVKKIKTEPLIVSFTPSQEFIRETFTPRSKTHGMLLFHSVGTGKTCTAIATASTTFEPEDYTLLYVTRHTLKVDVQKNMFEQVCSLVVQAYLKAGKSLPEATAAKNRLISKKWFEPMSYRQFSNMLDNKSRLHDDLVKINGSDDPLHKTLVIIDEAHKLFASDVEGPEKADINVITNALYKSYKTSGKQGGKVLLMTATPYTNDPLDMIKLLNLLRPENKLLPQTFETFSEKYLNDQGNFTDSGKIEFVKDINGYVSYLNREKDIRSFAYPIIHNVRVNMSDYSFIEDLRNIIYSRAEVNGQMRYIENAKARIKSDAYNYKQKLAEKLNDKIKEKITIKEEVGKELEERLKKESVDINKKIEDGREECNRLLEECLSNTKEQYKNLEKQLKEEAKQDAKATKDKEEKAIIKQDLKLKLLDLKEDRAFDLDECKQTGKTKCMQKVQTEYMEDLEEIEKNEEIKALRKKYQDSIENIKKIKESTNAVLDEMTQEFIKEEEEKIKSLIERVERLRKELQEKEVQLQVDIKNDQSQRTGLEKCLEGKIPPAIKTMLKGDSKIDNIQINSNEDSMKSLEKSGAMDNIYLISGHGFEKVIAFEKRKTMPKDKALVIFPVCSQPNYMNIGCNFVDIFKNPDNKKYLSNPIKYKRELNHLLRFPIRVILPGDKIPDLYTTLFLNFEKEKKTIIVKSGVYRLGYIPSINRDILEEPVLPQHQLGAQSCKHISGMIDSPLDYDTEVHKEVFRKNVFKPASAASSYKNLEHRDISINDILDNVGTGIYYYIGCRSSHGDIDYNKLNKILEESDKQQNQQSRSNKIKSLVAKIRVEKDEDLSNSENKEIKEKEGDSKSKSASDSPNKKPIKLTKDDKEKVATLLKEITTISEGVYSYEEDVPENIDELFEKWKTTYNELRKPIKRSRMKIYINMMEKIKNSLELLEYVNEKLKNNSFKEIELDFVTNKQKTFYTIYEATPYMFKGKKLLLHKKIYGVVPYNEKSTNAKCTSKMVISKIKKFYKDGETINLPKSEEEYKGDIKKFEEVCRGLRYNV